MHLLGDQPVEEMTGLLAHLDGCAECQAIASEMTETAAMLKFVDPSAIEPTASVPPDLTARVLGELHAVGVARHSSTSRGGGHQWLRRGTRGGPHLGDGVLDVTVLFAQSAGPRIERRAGRERECGTGRTAVGNIVTAVRARAAWRSDLHRLDGDQEWPLVDRRHVSSGQGSGGLCHDGVCGVPAQDHGRARGQRRGCHGARQLTKRSQLHLGATRRELRTVWR